MQDANTHLVSTYVTQAGCAVVFLVSFPVLLPAEPPLREADKVSIRHIDVSQMTVQVAEAAIQVGYVCVQGKPVAPGSKLPSIKLKARDGDVYVHSVSLPRRVRQQSKKGYDVTVEFQGEIRRAPPKSFPFGNRCYASDETRFAWDVRDPTGAIIETGESQVVDGKWVEIWRPIAPQNESKTAR